jgi:hypothetical protein
MFLFTPDSKKKMSRAAYAAMIFPIYYENKEHFKLSPERSLNRRIPSEPEMDSTA